MNLLILDNQDSFSYNLFHLLKEAGASSVDVRPTAAYPDIKMVSYDGVVLSPGPGLPDEHEYLKEAIRNWMWHIPIWGICLGHQAIAEVCGRKLYQLSDVLHGIQSKIEITDRSRLWSGIDEVDVVGRYHSWMVDHTYPLRDLIISSIDSQGRIMSFYHKDLPLFGVQFHPESYMTKQGLILAKNFIAEVRKWKNAALNHGVEEKLVPAPQS